MMIWPRTSNLAVWLLTLSTLIPIGAAATPGDPPFIAGVIDVALAVLLFVLLMLLYKRRHTVSRDARAKSYEICQWLAALPLLLLPIYLSGAHLKWDVLLIGLAWRSWYFVTILPYLVIASARRP